MAYLIKTTSGETIGRLELAHDLVVEPEQQAPATPPPPPQVEYRKVMTAAAGNFTYEAYQKLGWTDQALVSNGLMTVEEVVIDAPQAQTGELHPSVAQTQMGAEWQPEPPQAPPAPEVPPAPQPEQPPVPTPPPVPQAPPAAPQPVPTPPPVPQAPPAAPQQATGGPHIPEHCQLAAEPAPVIPGREFMIKDVSYEQVKDKDGAWFDGRIHGKTKLDSGEEVPATRKDGTFTKRRGVPPEEYARLLHAQKPGTAPAPDPQQQGPAVPPPPSATGAVPPPPQATGAVPPPPAGQGSVTAPPPPANLQSLEGALQEWGDEM